MAEQGLMEKLVSLSKRRGFIFQSSEIYGGLGSVWDYGPLGVELQKGQVIRVELGQLPISWMVYGRWSATLALAIIVVAGIFIRIRRSGTSRPASHTHAEPPPVTDTNDRNARRRRRRLHRKGRRAA